MKKYNGPNEKPRKSWALELRSDGDHVFLCAVDAYTGEAVSRLVSFYASGRVLTYDGAEDEIKSNGYDPYEHSNTFNQYGSLLVESQVRRKTW